MKTFWSLCIVALFTAILPVRAFAAGVDDIVEKLQKNYDSISSIEASFSQNVFSASLNKSEKSEGKVFFKKPGKWKWLYSDTAKGSFTSNGAKVWLYDPELNQVIEKRVDERASGITTDFLTGVGKLKSDFSVKLAEKRQTTLLLELTPKTQLPYVKVLFLEVDSAKVLVVKTIVTDYLGNRTEISFKDIQINPQIKDSVFEFEPPKNSIVVRP